MSQEIRNLNWLDANLNVGPIDAGVFGEWRASFLLSDEEITEISSTSHKTRYVDSFVDTKERALAKNGCFLRSRGTQLANSNARLEWTLRRHNLRIPFVGSTDEFRGAATTDCIKDLLRSYRDPATDPTSRDLWVDFIQSTSDQYYAVGTLRKSWKTRENYGLLSATHERAFVAPKFLDFLRNKQDPDFGLWPNANQFTENARLQMLPEALQVDFEVLTEPIPAVQNN